MKRYLKHIIWTLWSGCLLIIACNSTGPDKEDAEETQKKPVAETPKADDQYVMQGKVVAQTAASALMTELTKALAQGNIEQAILYCNLRAMPVMDSLSFLYKARIKRTSMKVRNQKNLPDEEEKQALAFFENQLQKGEALTPYAETGGNGKTRFYAPIFVQALCLNCHGTPEKEVTSDNLMVIRQLYPHDQAIGYRPGDFRGMWSITFEN